MGDEALEGGANGKIRTKPEADLLHFYCVMRKTASPIQSQESPRPLGLPKVQGKEACLLFLNASASIPLRASGNNAKKSQHGTGL